MAERQSTSQKEAQPLSGFIAIYLWKLRSEKHLHRIDEPNHVPFDTKVFYPINNAKR